MKYGKLSIVFSLTAIALFQSSNLVSQCNSRNFSDACIPKLGAGFNFLKSYPIETDGDVNKVEYSYVFTKGTQYMITLCAAGPATDGIMATILDSNRNIVATNKIDGRFAEAIAYTCNSTGIYYMKYTFEGDSARCGGSALGFSR